jgi:hypothetical protein
VKTIQEESKDRSQCWISYHEISELMKVYEGIEVCKIDRVSNGLAHTVAQLGKSGVSSVSYGEVPTCVADPCERL